MECEGAIILLSGMVDSVLGPIARFRVHRHVAQRLRGKASMEVSTPPRQSVVVNARRLIAKLSRFKAVFALSSAGYCAIGYWLVVHNFASHVFLGALVFGAMAAVVVAWLSDIVRET